MFLRNVGWLSTDYTALYPRRLRHVPPKRRLTFNGLHGFISQKITAVRTSNSTQFKHCFQNMELIMERKNSYHHLL
jgi:hypothetical protein